ncbi:hypothetical protein B0H14DRAFT_1480780 [Mycena olivaceomarginata]|nr:hypothetical protein B0H14DRAFT_1480780 [Mycena olivaceomarginata]
MLYCTTRRKHLGLVLAALAAFADRHNMSPGALVEGSLRRPPNRSAFETPAWTLPKLRLSTALASLENWEEIGTDMEIFDATNLLNAFRSP